MAEHLSRYLARSGVASRRAAAALIAGGSVRVNGRRPPPEGMLVEAGSDRVTVDGKLIAAPAGHRYLALNKPEGVIATARDPEHRTTVFDLLPEELRPTAGVRLFTVGRLDAGTTGLLLLTNDGELTNRLAHPRHKVPKEYMAVVRGIPSTHDLDRLRRGIELDDGLTLPAQVVLEGSARGLSQLRLVITEGRNRQVRRMMDAIDHPVRELTRTAFGPVRLGRLKSGSCRRLRPPELAALRKAVGIDA